MATTSRSVLRQMLLEALGEYRSLTTSSAGAGDFTTLVDISLANYGESADAFPGWWVLLTSGTYSGEEGRSLGASGFATPGTITFAEPFTGQVANSVTYLLSKFRFADIHAALNAGIRAAQAGSNLYLSLRDQSIVVDNILSDSGFEGTVAGGAFPAWTNVGAGITVTAQTSIVKHLTQSGRIVAGGGAAGQMTQTPDINIGEFTGKTMNAAFWVYTTAASTARIRVDWDGGTTFTNSDYHSGLDQWELIKMSAAVPDAASEFTFICEAAASGRGYFDAGWASLGRIYRYTVPTSFVDGPYTIEQQTREDVIGGQDDGTFARLAGAPTEGRVLNLIGKGRLTEPSSDTATTEVDGVRAELIVAHAGRWLSETMGHVYDNPMLDPLVWERRIDRIQDSQGVKMHGLPAERSDIYKVENDASGRYIALRV